MSMISVFPPPLSTLTNSPTLDYSDDEDDDVTKFSTLDMFSDFLLSIESAKLKIGSGSGGDRPRRIYGDIHIGCCTYGKAFTVYHRTADEAETVSPSSEADLTLGGPRYHVYAREPEILYVDLQEEEIDVQERSTRTLLQERVRFDRMFVEPNKPFQMSAAVGDCVLTVHMTAFAPSVVTRISVRPVGFSVVSGTISAVQTTLDSGLLKRTVPLFRRPEPDPIEIEINDHDHDSGTIPLDRDVVVCPIHTDDDLVQLAYDMTLLEGVEPAFKPSDPVHGKGSSFVIHVDLKATMMIDGGRDQGTKRCSVAIRGAPEFNLMASHQVGLTYVADIVASDDYDEKIKVKVCVTHFLKYSCGDMADEVYERELPLYQPKSHDSDSADDEEDV